MCSDRIYRATAVMALLCVVVPVVTEGSQRQEGKSDTCGPLALKTCLMLLGEEVEASACADLAETSDAGETTMGGLAAAAEKLGQNVLSLRLSPAELAALNHPAILHVSYPQATEHFSVFSACQHGTFHLINPTVSLARELLSEQQLESIWDGRCIVFTEHPARDKLSLTWMRSDLYLSVLCGLAMACAASRIAVRKTHWTAPMAWAAGLVMLVGVGVLLGLSGIPWRQPNEVLTLGMHSLDLGDLPAGSPAGHDTWLANTSSRTLSIDAKRTRASCSCLRVSVDREELSGGERGVLKLRLAPRQRLGPFAYRAYVVTADPTLVQTLTVRGNVIGPGKAFPPRLYFGRIRPGEVVTRTFEYVPMYPGCKAVDVMSNSPVVSCRLLQSTRGVIMVGVSLVAPSTGGAFQGSIYLTVNDLEETKIELPVDGVVVAD